MQLPEPGNAVRRRLSPVWLPGAVKKGPSFAPEFCPVSWAVPPGNARSLRVGPHA